jgi:hypothetical protein
MPIKTTVMKENERNGATRERTLTILRSPGNRPNRNRHDEKGILLSTAEESLMLLPVDKQCVRAIVSKVAGQERI